MSDDVVARAAQLSFYFILGLFPFLLFLIATLGYFAETGTELRANLLRYLSKIAPAKAGTLIQDIVTEISKARSGGKSLSGCWLPSRVNAFDFRRDRRTLLDGGYYAALECGGAVVPAAVRAITNRKQVLRQFRGELRVRRENR